MVMLRALIAFSGVAFASACYLQDVDISGKGCPCVSGYECDAGVCLAAGQGRDASVDSDPDGDPCQPLLQVESFRAEWSTPNSIRWAWNPRLEDEDSFFEYRLVLAESIEDVQDESGTARRFDQQVNAELGRFTLPRLSGSDDLVLGTTTDGLRHSTPYFGQLVVVDRFLCEYSSPIVPMSTTIELTNDVVIFRDDRPSGSPNPSGFLPQPDQEGSGSHLAHIPDSDEECNSIDPLPNVCPNNLRWTNLASSLAEIDSDGLFETSIFELLLWYDGVNPSYWSHLWLAFDPDQEHFSFQVFTIRSTTGYEVIQVPLQALQSDGTPLSFEFLASHDILNEFCVYGRWERFADESSSILTRVRVDEVRIRY